MWENMILYNYMNTRIQMLFFQLLAMSPKELTATALNTFEYIGVPSQPSSTYFAGSHPESITKCGKRSITQSWVEHLLPNISEKLGSMSTVKMLSNVMRLFNSTLFSERSRRKYHWAIWHKIKNIEKIITDNPGKNLILN